MLAVKVHKLSINNVFKHCLELDQYLFFRGLHQGEKIEF